MFSEEGERVALCRSFNPKSAAGNVERWLIDCEALMRDTCREVTAAAHAAYAGVPRSQWILQWPGQVVICASQARNPSPLITRFAAAASRGLPARGWEAVRQQELTITK